MNFLRQIFSKIDIVVILTVISYGLVFAFYRGEYLYKGIPFSFIELNITTLSSGLFLLGGLLLSTSSMLIQAFEARAKWQKVTILFVMLFLLIVFLSLKLYPGVIMCLIIIIGMVIVFNWIEVKNNPVILITLITFGMIGTLFVGYSLTYFDLNKQGSQYIVKKDNNKYWVAGIYKDNYIVSKINTSDNNIKREYELIPMESKEDIPTVIMRENIKLNFID